MKLNICLKRGISMLLAVIMLMSNLALVTSAEDTIYCGVENHVHTDECHEIRGIVAPTIPSIFNPTEAPAEPEATETTPVTEAPSEPEATETTPVTEEPSEPEATELPDTPTFFEQLLAMQSLQELHDSLMGDTQAARAMTAEELTALQTHAEALFAAIAEPNQDDEDYYTLIVETMDFLLTELTSVEKDIVPETLEEIVLYDQLMNATTLETLKDLLADIDVVSMLTEFERTDVYNRATDLYLAVAEPTEDEQGNYAQIQTSLDVFVLDLANGSIQFLDDSVTYFDTEIVQQTVLHNDSNVYIITQSISKATTNTISIGQIYHNCTEIDAHDSKNTEGISASICVTKDFFVVLNGVNIHIDTEGVCAFDVSNKTGSTVVVVLEDNSTNYVCSGLCRAGVEKHVSSGSIDAGGSLLITCRTGYTEWKNNSEHGHTSGSASGGCNPSCGQLTATSVNTTTAGVHSGAGIGSGANLNGGTLCNITIAGGNIDALGGRGGSTSSGGGAGIGTGAAPEWKKANPNRVAPEIVNLIITGGTINAKRGSCSSANIGGGYRGGYANITIYGGDINATEMVTQHSGVSSSNKKKMRAAAIGAGGGGEKSSSPEGATVTIYNGTIRAKGQYGSAIGAGAGGSEGDASTALVYIYGGNITATTDKGAGKGAGAAIGAGGSLGTGHGGAAVIYIYGGTIIATSEYGADIGGGGTQSAEAVDDGGNGTIVIEGGTITALSGGIGGGKSIYGNGGDAEVTITGGTITAPAIGGGDSVSGNGGNAHVTVNGENASITLTGLIGGGNSKSGKGGDASVTMHAGNLICSAIGGGNSESGNGGNITGLTDENGEPLPGIYITGGTIQTGEIGGGTNTTGHVGYASALITGGDIRGQFVMRASDKPCTFEMSGGTIHGVDLSTTTKVGDTTFIHTRQRGGAVYMDDPNGVTTISGGAIEDCKALQGGAVYMTGGDFTLDGTAEIRNCEATEDGGAVYLGGGHVEIKNGTVAGNSAAVNGGGIAINNGNIVMSGGQVLNNVAQTGSGGGMFVSSTGSDPVSATIFSGTVSNNAAAVSGGAVGMKGSETSILTVQIGVNHSHYNEAGELTLNFTHGENNQYTHKSCPVIENNKATTSGGAFFISGGSSTNLKLYCLRESGNEATGDVDVNQVKLSNFLMVEGGNVLITTADEPTYVEPTYDDAGRGSSVLTGSIHITGGSLKIYGTMDNPKIDSLRTIDLKSENDTYADYRGSSDSGDPSSKIVKVSYHENFDFNGVVDSTQTALDIKHGEPHTFYTSLYVHEGYELVGWNTQKNAVTEDDGVWYPAGDTYTFYYGTNPDNSDDATDFENKKHYGDLILYAIWRVNGYFVDFDPGVPAGEKWSGSMTKQTYSYDVEHQLPSNAFARPGYTFHRWKLDDQIFYEDKAIIKNLTPINGDTVTLVAQWTECNHPEKVIVNTTDAEGNPIIEEQQNLLYSANGDTITKTCKLCGLTGTAKISAQNAVYDGNSHFATVEFSNEKFFGTLPPASSEGDSTGAGENPGEDENTEETIVLPAPTYQGTKIGEPNGGQPVVEPQNCIAAGDYVATLTFGDATVTASFQISKADQPAPTARPTYTLPDSGKSDLTIHQIPETQREAANDDKSRVEYIIRYHDSNDELQEVFIKTTATSENNLSYSLTTEMTTYSIHARYEETDNYNASPDISADTTFFFSSKLFLIVRATEGISFTEVNESAKKVVLTVDPRYYLVNKTTTDNWKYDFTIDRIKETDVTAEQWETYKNYGDGKAAVQIAETAFESNELSITADTTNLNEHEVYGAILTIGTAKKRASLSSAAKEKQHFSDVEGNQNVSISRDSAFTVFYKVTAYDEEDYQIPELAFTQKNSDNEIVAVNLPVGTTVIMRDRSNGNYYYHKADTGVSTISLGQFKQMGTATDTLFVANTGDLKLQFVVDFSRVEQNNLLSGTDLICNMLVNKKVATSTAPVLDKKPVNVSLGSVSGTMSRSSTTTGLTQSVTLGFTVGAAASKYDHRDLAIVLTSVSSPKLPIDASIMVTIDGDNVSYWPNMDGKFVIPLKDFPRANSTEQVDLRLISVMFPPSTETKYNMTAELWLAASNAEGAPMNGSTLASDSLTFTSYGTTASVRITVAEDKRLYLKSDSITATVSMATSTSTDALPDGYSLTVQLHRQLRRDDGTLAYGNTALNPAVNGKAYTFPLNSFQDGNYCVVAMVKNANNYVVSEAKYYFIIHNPTN